MSADKDEIPRRAVSLDTETTGLLPEEGHRIIEIGCVEIVNGQETGRVFHEYLDPDRDVPEDAVKVHGLTRDFLKGKPRFADVADRFLEFVGDATLIIHNAQFDLRFLAAELERIGRTRLDNDVCDTLILARRRFPRARASLDALCRRFGVDASERTLHGALLDASLLARVYVRMMGIDGLSLAHNDVSGNPNLESRPPVRSPMSRRPRPTRPVTPPSAEELAAHMALIAEIKDPLWAAFSMQADQADAGPTPSSGTA